MAKFIKINPDDNVAVCLEAAVAGESVSVDGQQIVVLNNVPVGHKVALTPVALNADVVKYGAPIGHAIAEIAVGEHVHTHNLKTNLSGTITYSFNQKLNEIRYAKRDLTFNGYRRSNGNCGIRN